MSLKQALRESWGRNRKAIIRNTAIGLAVGVVALGTLVHFTMEPGFCGSCHIMRPYYAEWKSSSHSMVPCVECHINPGWMPLARRKVAAVHELVSLVTGKAPYRPLTQVDNVACNRPGCHDVEKLTDQRVFGKGVTFSHHPHLDSARVGERLHCVTCHSQSADRGHFAVDATVCVTCHMNLNAGSHMAVNDSCLSCHVVPPEPITLRNGSGEFSHTDFVKEGVHCRSCHWEATMGEATVDRNACAQCHKDRDMRSRIGEKALIHRKHITDHKVECTMCHERIRHEVAMSHHGGSRGECQSCHRGTFSPTILLYGGRGGRGIPEGDIRSSHSLREVDCVACHGVENIGMHFTAPGSWPRADGRACVACHDGDARGYLDTWQTDMGNLLKTAEEKVAAARRGAGDHPPAEAAQIFDDAEYNITFVRRAHGVHNIEYATELLTRSIAAVEELSVSK